MQCRTLFYPLLTVCLLSVSATAAQSMSPLVTYHFPAPDDSLTTNVPLNEISTRAFRHFVKDFGHIPSATWRKGERGYSVKFYSADSVLHIVDYDLRGGRCDDHLYYNDANAPADIRAWMARVYSGDSILFVNELNDGSKSIYNVGLTAKGELRIVEIRNEEIRTIQLFVKNSP